MLKTELKLPFVWYTALNKQHRFRPQNTDEAPFALICGNAALLPFQIKRPTPGSPDTITEFKLYDLTDTAATNLLSFVGLIEEKHTDTLEYLTYKGNTLTDTVLPSGCYYAKIVKGTDTYYSEIFTVKSSLAEYLKLEWSHTCDIDPVMYQTGLVNTIYLDTYTEPIPPEVNEEGEENGAGEFTPTLQRIVHKHKIEIFAPDYLLDALAFMQIHNTVQITDYTDTSEMERIKVSPDYGDNYAGSCKIEFELPGDYVATNCCSNIALID